MNPESVGLWVILAYYLLYLWVVYRILTRKDFDTSERILWLLVTTLIPVIGVIYYGAITPPAELDEVPEKEDWLEEETEPLGK